MVLYVAQPICDQIATDLRQSRIIGSVEVRVGNSTVAGATTQPASAAVDRTGLRNRARHSCVRVAQLVCPRHGPPTTRPAEPPGGTTVPVHDRPTTTPAPPDTPATTLPATTLPATTLPATTLRASAIVDWDDPAVIADLGDGWQLHACAGDAPLLCASRDGEEAGVVEAHAFAITSVDVIDPAAAAADNLAALAADYLAIFETDRAAGCGAGYEFEPIPPNPIVLGGASGLAYGFVGRMPDGAPSEVQLQYAAIVESKVLLLTASAYDEGGCPGRDDLGGFTSSQLLELRDPWEAILPAVPLPQLQTPPPPP